MPSPAELAALLLVAAAPIQDAPPASAGPRASSNEGQRVDVVGYAGTSDAARGVSNVGLAPGSFVEVTALDTGRTALFEVTGNRPAVSAQSVAMSADAMRQIGVAAGAPIRVRAANPSPPDIAALRAGQPAGARLDAPEVLLVGLRNRLPPRQANASAGLARAATGPKSTPPVPAVKPAAVPAARPTVVPATAAPASGWGVQVAALSNADRARTLAATLGGQARASGNLWRIQLGPFADRAAAERARADLARRGHPGAALVRLP